MGRRDGCPGQVDAAQVISARGPYFWFDASAAARLRAELMRPTWVKAWGKLPTRRLRLESYSSESTPTSLTTPPKPVKINLASSTRPMRARQSTSQNVQGRKAPSRPDRP